MYKALNSWFIYASIWLTLNRVISKLALYLSVVSVIAFHNRTMKSTLWSNDVRACVFEFVFQNEIIFLRESLLKFSKGSHLKFSQKEIQLKEGMLCPSNLLQCQFPWKCFSLLEGNPMCRNLNLTMENLIFFSRLTYQGFNGGIMWNGVLFSCMSKNSEPRKGSMSSEESQF